MVLGQDANFTVKSFINRYNSDLANDLGNLLSRISTLIKKNYNGQIPKEYSLGEKEHEIRNKSVELVKKFDKNMSCLSINEAIEEVLQFVRGINRYFEHKAPWKLVKNDLESAGKVLYTGAEALRICAILLTPVMPKRMKLLLSILNTESFDRTWGNLESGKLMGEHKPLFPRINSKNN